MFFCLSIVESHKRCKFHRFFKCHLLSLKCTVNSNFLYYWYQTFIYLFFLHFLIPEVRCFRFLCSYNYVFFFFSLFFLSFFFLFGHFSDTFRLPLFSPCQPVYREYPLLPAWPEGSDYGFVSLILLLHLVSVLLNFNDLSRCKQDNTLDLY